MTPDIVALLRSRWLAALGLGFLHAVWQVALIIAVTALALREMRGARASARYAMAYAALLLLPAVCAGTVWRIGAGASLPLVVPFAGAAWLAPWAGCAWIAGVSISSLRLAAGWMRLQRLRASAAKVSQSWQAAVDAIADRLGIAQVARLGLSWGLGHSLTLLFAGGGLALVRMTMPERATEALEAGVGVMLVMLGLRALRSAHVLATRGPNTPHTHGALVHVHATSAAHVHLGPFAVARRPLVVGMVHGLAGSGALAALAMATLPTIDVQIVFMILFGVGSTAGMATLSGLAGLPLARLARQPVAFAWVSAAVGVVSMIAGVVWSAPLVGRWL